MTLQDFFNWVKVNPYYTLAYFILIPVIALLAGIFAKNEGHQSPWKYVYTTLIYLVCIPGIFAVTFNIYLFFWERSSIMDAEILLGILLTLMWILDRTHFFVFASMPFPVVILIIVGGILLIRMSLKRMLS